jgi:hypothetical protein
MENGVSASGGDWVREGWVEICLSLLGVVFILFQVKVIWTQYPLRYPVMTVFTTAAR